MPMAVFMLEEALSLSTDYATGGILHFMYIVLEGHRMQYLSI